jgi:hypothetical protein
VLTHTGFADADERDQHLRGWGDCLDRLEHERELDGGLAGQARRR